VKDPERQWLSILNRIKILVQDLVHGEHVDLILLEHLTQRSIADDLSLIVRVLQLVLVDVLPDAFDALWSR
jgi:hypothetical protein